VMSTKLWFAKFRVLLQREETSLIEAISEEVLPEFSRFTVLSGSSSSFALSSFRSHDLPKIANRLRSNIWSRILYGR
jgi:hypothetical protein